MILWCCWLCLLRPFSASIPLIYSPVRGRLRWTPDCQAPAASPTESNTEEELRPWCSAVRRNSSNQLTFRWEGAWVGLTQSAECFKSGSRDQTEVREAGRKRVPRVRGSLLSALGWKGPRGRECGQPLGADSRSGLPAHRKEEEAPELRRAQLLSTVVWRLLSLWSTGSSAR